MEYVIITGCVVYLLWISYLIVSGVSRISQRVRRTAGKFSVWGCAVILPLLFLAAVWVYNGIAFCSCCRAVTINTYTEDKWIITVDVCRDCVKYIDCGSLAHLTRPPRRPEVCLSCDGNINMHNDELGECFARAFVTVWVLEYWAVMMIWGIVWLIKQIRKKFQSAM